MTDLEKFIELYKSVGIDLPIRYEDDGMPFLKIKEHDKNKKIIGYPWFYTDICFDKDGTFIEQGIWE